MDANLLTAYRKARQPHFSPYNDRAMYVARAQSALWQARHAIAAAETKRQWDDINGANGYTVSAHDAEHYSPCPGESWRNNGRVRIVEHADEHCDLDDLFGDSFDSQVNPEIKAKILERERAAEIDRIQRDGVWGYVSEYWDGNEWQHADSVWGFIGDDFNGSGYDTDLMCAAMDGLATVQEREARCIEATRADMYATA